MSEKCVCACMTSRAHIYAYPEVCIGVVTFGPSYLNDVSKLMHKALLTKLVRACLLGSNQ